MKKAIVVFVAILGLSVISISLTLVSVFQRVDRNSVMASGENLGLYNVNARYIPNDFRAMSFYGNFRQAFPGLLGNNFLSLQFTRNNAQVFTVDFNIGINGSFMNVTGHSISVLSTLDGVSGFVRFDDIASGSFSSFNHPHIEIQIRYNGQVLARRISGAAWENPIPPLNMPAPQGGNNNLQWNGTNFYLITTIPNFSNVTSFLKLNHSETNQWRDPHIPAQPLNYRMIVNQVAAPQSFSITWRHTDGAIVNTQTLQQGTVIQNNVAAPEWRNNLQFSHWRLDQGQNFGQQIQSNTIFTAIYVQIWRTVTWQTWYEGIIHDQILDLNATIPNREPPYIPGAEFSHWEVIQGQPVGAQITSNTILRASYTTEVQYITVTWQNMDGGTIYIQNVRQGTTITDMSPPVITGYNFQRWDVIQGQNIGFPITSTTIMRAVFDVIPYIPVSVIFRDVVGRELARLETIRGRIDVSQVPTPVLASGQVFNGWFNVNGRTIDGVFAAETVFYMRVVSGNTPIPDPPRIPNPSNTTISSFMVVSALFGVLLLLALVSLFIPNKRGNSS